MSEPTALTIGPLTITEIQISGRTDFIGPEPPCISMTFWSHARFDASRLLELAGGERVEITVRALEAADEQP